MNRKQRIDRLKRIAKLREVQEPQEVQEQPQQEQGPTAEKQLQWGLCKEPPFTWLTSICRSRYCKTCHRRCICSLQ